MIFLQGGRRPEVTPLTVTNVSVKQRLTGHLCMDLLTRVKL